jgi:hypothetical protein
MIYIENVVIHVHVSYVGLSSSCNHISASCTAQARFSWLDGLDPNREPNTPILDAEKASHQMG